MNFRNGKIKNENRVDDMKFDKYEGLETIPIEIKSKGTQEIAKYILDLAKSSQSIYRTKLMVVGYENIGKTTLLDCLFPLFDEIESPYFFGFNYLYSFSLDGKCLKQYYQGKSYKQYILENKEWNVRKQNDYEIERITKSKMTRKNTFQEGIKYEEIEKILNENAELYFEDGEARDLWFEKISRRLLNKAIKKLSMQSIILEKIKEPKEKIVLHFENEERRDLWFERISKLVLNKATHGIEINTYVWKSSTLNQHQNKELEAKQNINININKNEDKEKRDDKDDIWKSSALNPLQNKDLETKQNGNKNKNEKENEEKKENLEAKQNRNEKERKDKDEKEEMKSKDDYVEFSTWDFAGQHDYYNTHHYFLSNRSTFLVLYRIDQGIKGLESLDFWLKSLSVNLNQNYCDENGKPFYSIIIVGTFLDSIEDDQSSNENLRQANVMEIYDKNGLKSPTPKENRRRRIEEIYDKSGLKSPPFYFEVSCSTLENIEKLRENIFNNSLSHSYMGENVPVGYLTIEKSIYELRKLNRDHPIMKIQDLVHHIQSQSQSTFEFGFDIEFVKRALKLLHEWGICIYFDQPIELSNIVVLDPQYLTKKVLGDLFKADESSRKMRLNGIIDYSQLSNIWNRPIDFIETYLLLEKFEVCFILTDQQNETGNETGNENENEKKIVIPNLLPDQDMINETKVRILGLMKELEELENSSPNQEKEKVIKKRDLIQNENQRLARMEYEMKTIKGKLEKKWPTTIPRGEIEIERIFSFNQVPSEMVSRLLVRFHNKIVDNIIWRRGVLLKNGDESNNILCLLEVKMLENLFEIRIRGKERKECLEMMKYIYDEVKIVSGNYRGVGWKECVRSPHFSKGFVNLDDMLEDCKLDLKDRKLICPITHFPIYGEELLFKTGLLDSLDLQDNFGTSFSLRSLFFFFMINLQ